MTEIRLDAPEERRYTLGPMRSRWIVVLFLLASCSPAGQAYGRRRRVVARTAPVDATLVCEGSGYTMLTCTAAQGRVRIVRNLLNTGSPINERDAMGATALHWASRNRRDDVVQVLLNRHADVNAKNRLGGTPLHWAAKQGDAQTAQLLLSHGAAINAVNNTNWTPLMIAANTGDSTVAKVLIDHGAQVGVKGSKGETAWDLAIANGHRDIAAMILRASRTQLAPVPASGSIVSAPAPKPQADSVDKAEVEKMIADAVKKAQANGAGAPPPLKASDVDKPTYASKENADNFALVIGIEKYSDIPEAEYAERDAAAVRDHLVALGYPERNIVSLLGSKATKTGIVKNIETWLPNNVTDKSTVFVYYSGHGAPDVKTGQSYLVPWDGDPEFLDDTAYPTKRLYEKLNELKAKRVIVALDSCFSGAGGRSVLAKGVRPLVNKIEADAVEGKTIALSAAGGDQVSRAYQEQGHGLFTYYLLRGLNGEAKNRSGEVTVGSLYGYLRTHVADAARRANGDQTPQLLPAGAEKEPVRLR